jgi:hypothetical protein
MSAEGVRTIQPRKGRVSGGTDLFNYSLGVSRLDTRGYSAAAQCFQAIRKKTDIRILRSMAKVGVNPQKPNVEFYA